MRVPARHKDHFKRFGELLRDGKKSWQAFEAVFPKGYAALLRAAKQRKEEHRPGGGKGTRAAPAAGSASDTPSPRKRRTRV